MSETKECSRCRETKPTSEFYWRNRERAGRKSCWSSYCKRCECDYHKRVIVETKGKADLPREIEAEKECRSCRVVKPASEFWERRQYRKIRLAYDCKDCGRAKAKRWREENRDKALARARRYHRELRARASLVKENTPNVDLLRRVLVEQPRDLASEDARAAYFRGFVAGAKRSGYESERFEKLKDLCHRIASEMSKWGKAGHFQSYEDNLGVAYEGLLHFIRKRKEYESDEHERKTAAMAIRNAIRDYARLEGPIKRAGNARYEQTIIPTDGDGEPVVVQASPDELWRDDGLRDSLDQLDLDPRSRAILEGLAAGVTYRELGERFGITESRACQVAAEIRERHGERLLAALT